MQRGLDRIFRAAVGVAGGGDLQFVAGQEVHGEAADFLAGVVGDGDYLGVLAFSRIDFVKPGVVFSLIGETWIVIRISNSRLPFDAYCHARLPARRRDVTAPPAPSLIRTDDVQPRMAIDAKLVDGPMGMIDRFEGACMDEFCLHRQGKSDQGAKQRAPREY
ncbi:hypothetical protein VC35_21120 [Pseudomonas fluorescens]|uniref:Uncharacterized protein n=1 Tax=Pseudomonas fluorescens TaxID=294 RepID=A0A0F4TFV3_PSEFL|nr:hypothetical protein VC35_21120 [Pseudomonas fluorescens]